MAYFKVKANLDCSGIVRNKSLWECQCLQVSGGYLPAVCRTQPSVPNGLLSVEPQRGQWPSGESECSLGQWGTITATCHCAGTTARQE